MKMYDKISFDRCYCINSAQTKKIMVHNILQPRYIFICLKDFILILIPSGVQLLIIRLCFVWLLCVVLTACAQSPHYIIYSYFLR